MVHARTVIAFAKLLADQASHHDLHPLLANDGVLSLLQPLVVIVIDAIEGGRDGRLLGQEGGGFGCRHGDVELIALVDRRAFI